MMPMTSSRILLLVGVVALVALPQLLSQSLVNASIQMLIAALFACAFNLLCGHGGMLSFGHAAYFGVGAFATVHAMNAFGGAGLVPTPLMPLAGGVTGLLVGIAAGWFATKRSGTYFAMITLALAELLHALAPHLKGLFGGEAGMSSMRMPAWGVSFGTPTQVYYLTLGWVLASLGLLYLLTLTPVGRLTLGLRENSHRLRFLGYDVHRLSVLAFALSAMFSGIAGGLQAVGNEAANYVVFEAGLSASVVLNTYIGGVKVFLGPALGAALMTFFGYAVSDMTRSWLLYQGLIYVLVMIYMPTGLAGLFQWWGTSSRAHGAARVAPVVALGMLALPPLAAGTVFSIEMAQRFFSKDYLAMAAQSADAAWAPIPLFGRDWQPDAPITWLLPVALLAVGALLMRMAIVRWHAVHESTPLDDEDVVVDPDAPEARQA